MAPDVAANLAESAALARLGPAAAAPRCPPAEVLARLRAGEVDEGMHEAMQCLAEDRADGPLVQALRENPFLRAALAPAHGYEGDPTFVDFALGVAPLPPDTTPLGLAMYRWMAARGSTFAAFRARRRHLAARLDRAADLHPGAKVVGLFAGHGRELSASHAWRKSRVAVQLIDFDARALERARHDNASWGQLLTRPGTLAEILAGRVALADCALVYAPSVAENLPDNTLAQLIEALVPALRPHGEIVIPAFTRLPEPGLLELAAEWEPNTRSVPRLHHLARGLDDVTATVHDDPVLGVAYLHVQRRPRSATTPAGAAP
jgi:hypothetical protein